MRRTTLRGTLALVATLGLLAGCAGEMTVPDDDASGTGSVTTEAGAGGDDAGAHGPGQDPSADAPDGTDDPDAPDAPGDRGTTDPGRPGHTGPTSQPAPPGSSDPADSADPSEPPGPSDPSGPPTSTGPTAEPESPEPTGTAEPTEQPTATPSPTEPPAPDPTPTPPLPDWAALISASRTGPAPDAFRDRDRYVSCGDLVRAHGQELLPPEIVTCLDEGADRAGGEGAEAAIAVPSAAGDPLVWFVRGGPGVAEIFRDATRDPDVGAWQYARCDADVSFGHLACEQFGPVPDADATAPGGEEARPGAGEEGTMGA